jgi:hypothetical protein
LIEIQYRDQLAVHSDVAAAVDALLRGYPLPPEVRARNDDGAITIEHPAPVPRAQMTTTQGYRRQSQDFSPAGERSSQAGGRTGADDDDQAGLRGFNQAQGGRERSNLPTIRIYPYGVARNRLVQAARRLGVPAYIVNDPGEAQVVVTLRAYYRKRQRTIVEAENRNTPIYVLRANTINQMQQFLGDLFNLPAVLETSGESGVDPVLSETRAAIEAVMNGERWVELQPAVSSIRRVQHQMAREANLLSHSYGKEPRRRVRIFRE